MTAITTVRPPASALGRVLNVVKLHVTNPWNTIAVPWMIMGIILLANLAIWGIILSAAAPADRVSIREGLAYSGGSTFIFVYMMVVAIQAISVTFPFALGFGVTRRDYYLGTALAFTGLAAMFSIGLTILAAIEDATGGWGLGGRLFTTAYFGENWIQRLFIYFAAFLFFFTIGMAAASIWVRWKANGIIAFFIGLGIVVIGGAALLTYTNSWGGFGNFFATAGLVGSFAWSLVIAAIAGISGFFVLRKATPKN
ncbi:MAG: ABC transporter permease [Salinibacterium sp.]|nr:ABC transporter permease [Salinibacterium sp.]